MVLYIPLKASQAQLKVGPYSIFMKLALCEIGFCLMDPCMGGAAWYLCLSLSAPESHWGHRDKEEGQIKKEQSYKKKLLELKIEERKNMQVRIR